MLLWVFLCCVGVGQAMNSTWCCNGRKYVTNTPYGQMCVDLDGNESQMQLTCPKTVTLVYSDELKFHVDYKNTLILSLPNKNVHYEFGTYCQGRKEFPPKDGNPGTVREIVVICNPEEVKMIPEDVYGYCMILSTVCLLITGTVYATKPQLRDLQGKSIINLCVSLGFGLSILVIMKLMPYSDMNFCAARGFLAYFFILVSFFWMNSISIQILWGLKKPVENKCESGKDFAWYAAYSWGVPAILTIFMAIINFMPGDHLKPGIGLNHCWFFNVEQQWHYMYSVVSVLILVNIIIFTTSTVFICCYGYPSQTECFRQKFVTCLQLLVVMGIPWVFEMIGSLVPPNITWEILDVFNSLQGVWIFLVLVLLPRRPKEEETSQYNINITVEQPYSKISKY